MCRSCFIATYSPRNKARLLTPLPNSRSTLTSLHTYHAGHEDALQLVLALLRDLVQRGVHHLQLILGVFFLRRHVCRPSFASRSSRSLTSFSRRSLSIASLPLNSTSLVRIFVERDLGPLHYRMLGIASTDADGVHELVDLVYREITVIVLFVLALLSRRHIRCSCTRVNASRLKKDENWYIRRELATKQPPYIHSKRQPSFSSPPPPRQPHPPFFPPIPPGTPSR